VILRVVFCLPSIVSPLDLNSDRYVVVRLRNMSEDLLRRIHQSFLKLKSMDIEYDFAFDSSDHRDLYCSELAAAVLETSQAEVTPFAFSPKSQRATELLRKTGVRSESFFGQGSYLGSPKFAFVAQRIYADPDLLIKGQMILDAFTGHLTHASEVLLRKHPDAHTIFGLVSLLDFKRTPARALAFIAEANNVLHEKVLEEINQPFEILALWFRNRKASAVEEAGIGRMPFFEVFCPGSLQL